MRVSAERLLDHPSGIVILKWMIDVIAGQATALTTFSTLKPWGRWFLPGVFALTRRYPALTKRLRELSFIHFAAWTVIRELPYNGPPQHQGRLHKPYLFFESNFNGGWEEYIDAFAHKLTRGMILFWGSSHGFPGPLPTRPFKTYIRGHEAIVEHYYAAYDATTRQIERALKLSDPPVPSGDVATRMFMAMTPIRPGATPELQRLLRDIAPSPFAQLPRAHFARFAVTPISHTNDHPSVLSDYLVFTTNFDGPTGTYLDELCAIPTLNDIWGHCIGAPAHPATLKGYLEHNRMKPGLFYSAYSHATVQQVQAALTQFPPATATWTSNTPTVRVHVARCVAIAEDAYERSYIPGTLALRDQHPREFGTIHGELTVRAPDGYRHGIFAEPNTYPVIARFSPNSPIALPWNSDAYAISIKILLPQTEDTEKEITFDILAANSDVFFCRNAADYVELATAKVKGGLQSLLTGFFFPSVRPRRWRLRELRNMIRALTSQVHNPLLIDYFTQTPGEYGPCMAKLAVQSKTVDTLAGDDVPPRTRRDLKAAMAEHLVNNPARFSLAVQKQAEGDPVNDPTIRWANEFVPVAELFFPAQTPTSGEHLEFTVAHAPTGHKPVGEINEVRVAVYDRIAALRHEKNHVARLEPTSADLEPQ